MQEIVFLNGHFLKTKDAKISLLEPGFLYGWGLFETMRACHNRIVYFDAHLARIKASCASLDMKFPYALNKLKEIIRRAMQINGFADACVRLTLWKAASGTGTLVTVKKYKPYSLQKYRTGFHACIWRFKQNENYFLNRLKTTNYLFYQLAYQEAKNKRFDEALILNHRGYITEGSRANIFFLKDNQLWTPALECGCLAGITRKVILDLAEKNNIPANEGNFTLYDLYDADEVFFTNSLMGVMPLACIEKNKIGKSPNNYKLTRFFIKRYQNPFPT